MGGIKDELHFQNLQNLINQILQTDINLDDKNQSIHYKQLLKNILFSNVCFNLPSVTPDITGESNIDLIVDKDFGDDNPVVIVVQHVIKFAISDLILGVLVIQTKTNNHYFMVDVSEIENKQSKVVFYLNMKRRILRNAVIRIYFSVAKATYCCYDFESFESLARSFPLAHNAT